MTFDHFSISRAMARDFIHIIARGVNTRDELTKVLWSTLYADNAGIASRSQVNLVKMMTPRVEVCVAFGLVVAEKMAVNMHKCFPEYRGGCGRGGGSGSNIHASCVFPLPWPKISSISDVTPEIHNRIGQARTCFYKHSAVLHDNPYIALVTKVRLQKTEVIEAAQYGCVTWKVAHDNFSPLRDAHRGFRLSCLIKHTSSRSANDYNLLPYHEVFQRTRHKCMEATVTRRTLLHVGRVVRMHDKCLPNIVMRGVMVGGQRKAGRPGRRVR